MKKAVLALLVIFVASPVLAQPYTQRECREKFCRKKPLSPRQKCKRKRGRWIQGVCYITKIRRIKSAPEIRRVTTERVITRPIYKVIKVPVQKTTIIREVLVREPTDTKDEPKKETPKTKDWWWFGPGAFAFGSYMSKDRFFLAGPQVKLAFALSDRFRISGTMGFAFWQKHPLLVGAQFEVRVIQNLYAQFGIETGWGDFEELGELAIKQRFFLGTIGLEYWIFDKASIALSFPLGFNERVIDCEEETKGNFIGGNMLSIFIYF